MAKYIVEIEIFPELPWEAQKEIEEAVKSIVMKYLNRMIEVKIVRPYLAPKKERELTLLPE